MRKWFLILTMAALLMSPSLAFAQNAETLTTVNVQMWPEYDQPSMLVITDYAVDPGTTFPVALKFRIPKDANLIAVASYTNDGNLIDAKYEPSKVEGEWQVFTVTLEMEKGRFEYYQPIPRNGNERSFLYSWDQDYAVNAFNVLVLEPLDTTSLTSTPELSVFSSPQGAKSYESNVVKLAANEQFTLDLKYVKTSDALAAQSPSVEPSAPLDNATSGRVSFENYLPYLLGGVGLLLVIGGAVYFAQAGKQSVEKKPRRRGRVKDEEGDAYCSQCGTRARGGDRFCRTCGSRIHKNED